MMAQDAKSPTGTTVKKATSTASESELIDLNTTSKEQLQTLPGIGDSYASCGDVPKDVRQDHSQTAEMTDSQVCQCFTFKNGLLPMAAWGSSFS
jgi:hypothetical protein